MAIGNNDRVLHPRYGSGTVMEVYDGNKLTILFDNGERLRIVSSFVMRWGCSEVILKRKFRIMLRPY